MKKKTFLKIILILSSIIIAWFVYSKYFKEDKNKLSKPVNPTSKIEEDTVYNSNIIKDINYASRDLKGNEYIIIEDKINIIFRKVFFFINQYLIVGYYVYEEPLLFYAYFFYYVHKVR